MPAGAAAADAGFRERLESKPLHLVRTQPIAARMSNETPKHRWVVVEPALVAEPLRSR
jgi:hypothetical protein